MVQNMWVYKASHGLFGAWIRKIKATTGVPGQPFEVSLLLLLLFNSALCSFVFSLLLGNHSEVCPVFLLFLSPSPLSLPPQTLNLTRRRSFNGLPTRIRPPLAFP